MIVQLYAMFDRKTAFYLPPVSCINEAEALRTIHRQLSENPKSLMAQYPEDYEVWRLGEYDDATGRIKAVTPESVCNLQSLFPGPVQQEIPFGKDEIRDLSDATGETIACLRRQFEEPSAEMGNKLKVEKGYMPQRTRKHGSKEDGADN